MKRKNRNYVDVRKRRKLTYEIEDARVDYWYFRQKVRETKKKLRIYMDEVVKREKMFNKAKKALEEFDKGGLK